MSDSELFMTEEFFAFSKNMKNLADAKHAKAEELRKLIETGKAEMLRLEEEAAKITAAWKEWSAAFTSKQPQKK